MWAIAVMALGAEIVDLAGQEPLTPPEQEADSAAHLDESEQFEYSSQASPPYPNRRAIQWAMPAPRPISAPIPSDPRSAAMRMPNVSPALFRGTVGAG